MAEIYRVFRAQGVKGWVLYAVVGWAIIIGTMLGTIAVAWGVWDPVAPLGQLLLAGFLLGLTIAMVVSVLIDLGKGSYEAKRAK
ncbi:MAG: hypothetical protein HY685_04160 [Chloroflexi bacterium]|nr:hypothetical protein [Chloroflexota bacterium]